MGFIRTILNTVVVGSAGAASSWAIWTRNSKFIPVPSEHPIFTSPDLLRNNPNGNPTAHDLCVRKVPLNQIKPALLTNEGRLTEAFCAGIYSGLGM
jgi:hypothetical protein